MLQKNGKIMSKSDEQWSCGVICELWLKMRMWMLMKEEEGNWGRELLSWGGRRPRGQWLPFLSLSDFNVESAPEARAVTTARFPLIRHGQEKER